MFSLTLNKRLSLLVLLSVSNSEVIFIKHRMPVFHPRRLSIKKVLNYSLRQSLYIEIISIFIFLSST